MNATAEHRHADVTASPSPELRARVIERLSAILPTGSLLYRVEDTRPFECDGLSAFRQLPMAVALPENEAQVREILRACHELDVPVVARGAGTSLSGGSMPHGAGIVLSLAKFNRILEIDAVARIARVQPGVRNLAVSEAVATWGLYYAPDPSSQIACSIGGNVAENSGGVHCLKYGLTCHNVLRVRVVMIDGEILEFGSEAPEVPGLDLLSLLIGSEGMLGVVTEVSLRLLPKPELARAVLAYFDAVEPAGDAVAAIIAAGIIPAGMEMMDQKAVHAVEPFVQAGYDLDAQAVECIDRSPGFLAHLIGKSEHGDDRSVLDQVDRRLAAPFALLGRRPEGFGERRLELPEEGRSPNAERTTLHLRPHSV
ncbi:MAG: FAD-binding protein, partial [Gemmatimonadales bacterium]|nr:FAD-binding protein [Gemmatimonadales bacterium]